MTQEKTPKDIVDILQKLREATLKFDVELEDKIKLPYLKLANKHLADVIGETIEDIKYARKQEAIKNGRQN